MNMKIFAVGMIIISTVLMATTTNDVFAKGLKVYLTIDSNQRSQDATIRTYQSDQVVDTRFDWIEQGITYVNIHRMNVPVDEGNAQSKSQSSNSQNENNNALSQSQETKIIICTAEKGCREQ
jgi:hypothetical protein